MLWYLGQSWLVILASFLLGLLIGWMVWRLPWQRKYVTESAVITRLTEEQTSLVASKDAEISRLKTELSKRQSTAHPVGASSLSAAGGPAPAAELPPAPAAAATSPNRAAVAPTEVEASAVSTPPAAAVIATTPTAHEQSRPGPAVAPAAKSRASEETDHAASPLAPAVAATRPDSAPDTLPVVLPVALSDGSQIKAGSERRAAEDASADTAPLSVPVSARSTVATKSAAGNGDAESDDLERVEGIGPRIAAALRSAGIHTYSELAASDVARLQGALEAAGLRFAPSLPTWSRQAALLAAGDEDGFMQLTDQLVGGRDIRRRS